VAGTCYEPTDIGDRPGSWRKGERHDHRGGARLRADPGRLRGPPRYELEFGRQRPLALTIATGASEFDLYLGGVPLRGHTVRQGAGKFELGFSEPNPEPMELLEVSSGAAGYDLDFGGVPLRDARVNVETGLSGVEISVPASTAARIVAETTLGRVDVGAGFTKQEGAFLTEGALSEGVPVLGIRAGVRLGATAKSDLIWPSSG